MIESQGEVKREPTSIKVDPRLWKDTKIAAIEHDITVSELIEEAIREWIKKREKQ